MKRNHLLVSLLLFIISGISTAQNNAPPAIRLADQKIDVGQTVCIDAQAEFLDSLSQLTFHFRWKWKNLKLKQIRYNTMIKEEDCNVLHKIPFPDYATLRFYWKGNKKINANVSLFQLCFEGLQPSRSSIVFTGQVQPKSSQEILTQSAFIHVANKPREITEYIWSQSTRYVLKDASFQIDPLMVSDHQKFFHFEFDLFFDTSLVTFDLKRIDYGPRSRLKGKFEPKNYGYHIIWPIKTMNNSINGKFPYQFFFTCRNIIDTTTKIWLDNFNIINEERDSFHIISDTAKIYIVDSIPTEKEMHLSSISTEISLDSIGKVPLIVERDILIKSFSLDFWEGNHFEIVGLSNDNSDFQPSLKRIDYRKRVYWTSDKPVQFAKGDTLLYLLIKMIDYTKGEEILVSGGKFISNFGESIALKFENQPIVRTKKYPSIGLKIKTRSFYAVPGDTVSTDLYFQAEKMFNPLLISSYQFDLYWDRKVLKLLDTKKEGHLVKYGTTTTRLPWKENGHPGMFSISWFRNASFQGFLHDSLERINISNLKFEVIGPVGSYSIFYLDHPKIRADTTINGKAINFSSGHGSSTGYANVAAPQDIITIRMDTTYSSIDHTITAAIILEGIDTFRRFNIGWTYPINQLQFIEYNSLNKEFQKMQVLNYESFKIGYLELRYSSKNREMKYLEDPEKVRLVKLRFKLKKEVSPIDFHLRPEETLNTFSGNKNSKKISFKFE